MRQNNKGDHKRSQVKNSMRLLQMLPVQAVCSRQLEQVSRLQVKIAKFLVALLLGLGCLTSWGVPTAIAGLTDDRYDGNIFPLYAGNGYLVPPRVTLAQSLEAHTPAVLVLYVDDSSDSKAFSPVISRLDAYYGRAANLIPVTADSIPPKERYEPTEPGYYYKGLVPQTVVFDKGGKVLLNKTGMVPYEEIDDVLRQAFDLLPRTESEDLTRRAFNEVNTELIPGNSSK
jgi:hypothetical protein